MKEWESDDLDGLLCESRTIQGKLKASSKPQSEERLKGKVKAAMKLFDEQDSAGVITLSQSTINELKRKHPEANEADPSVLIDGQMPFVDTVMFYNITEFTILKPALRTKGSGGLSGLDADEWRRIWCLRTLETLSKISDVHWPRLRETSAPLR